MADDWQAKVESWTATDNGPYAPKPYYLRVTKDAKPNVGTTYKLGDNFPRHVDQREIVDNSFLGLVLFGVKRHDDHDDPQLAPGRRRADRRAAAGEHAQRRSSGGASRSTATASRRDGGDWDLFFDNPQRQTFGRAWPLLAGERGEYELIAGKDASARLRAIANAANDGMMLPEQVWDGRPPNEADGEGTRSATPLAWTHAQFVRLAWSIQAGAPIERPSIVACRYQQQLCPARRLSATGPTRPGTPRPGCRPGSPGTSARAIASAGAALEQRAQVADREQHAQRGADLEVGGVRRLAADRALLRERVDVVELGGQARRGRRRAAGP